jgi:lipoate-protein ligase A
MKLHLIELTQTPIYEQLLLEEALLRADERNFCIINHGAPRAVVMGLSGIPEELLHLESIVADKIPVYKRYSGGGTVIIDEQTLFISFLISKKDLAITPYPEPIMRWSYDLYQKAWNLPDFTLHENDYAIKERKCGGNAQYLRKDRWMHHTSFLWDYRDENMEYLRLPKKRPTYRQDRSHNDFLCKLKEHAPLENLIQNLKTEIVKRFYIEQLSNEELEEIRSRSYRIATHSLTL